MLHAHALPHLLFGTAATHGGGPHGHWRHGPPWARAFMGFNAPFPGGQARAGRGDVRAAILNLLAEQPMHGYQLMQEMSDRSGGAWRPSPGSVYPTLNQLEDEGLVTSAKDGGRRVFSLTEEGRAAAEDANDAPWDNVGSDIGEDVASLREEAIRTAKAVMAVVSSGDPSLAADAATILQDARRSLYGLLAEDEV